MRPLKIQRRNDDKVLIIIEDNAESMDVTLTNQVFDRLKMPVVYAGRHKSPSFKLTDNFNSQAQITILAATKRQWKVIVLPGGNKAVSRLQQTDQLSNLLKHHIKTGGLVAAMGASATQLLPGYVDELGPTHFPIQGEATVVNREYNGQVWTAPGLGTATELALTVGEHLYGRPEAQRVSDEIGYVQGDWDITKLRDLTSHHNSKNGRKGGTPTTWQKRKAERVKQILTGFWEIVWPKLSDMGWKCEFVDTTHWVFCRPGIDHWKNGRKGQDWFDSQYDLLEHLHVESSSSSKEIMEEFNKRIAAEEKKSTAEKKCTEDKKKGPSQQDCRNDAYRSLFEHVVWNRLEFMGWRRLPGGAFMTPDSHSSCVKLDSPELVMEHLLNDPDFCTNSATLAVVDLYRHCERTQKSILRDASPEEIEELTKRKCPALSLY